VLGLEVLAVDSKSKILGHLTRLNSLNADLLKSLSEDTEVIVVIELSAVSKTTSPGEDRSDGVGGGGLTLLVLTPVTSDGTVSSLSLDGLTIGANEDGGHETERAVTLSNDIGLNITIVVLASPDHTTRRLKDLSDLIIDEAVLIPDTKILELLLVLSSIDSSEDILEETIVLLEDGVLGGEVEGPLLHEGILEARVSETSDGVNGVVHGHTATTLSREVEDLGGGGLGTISGGELDLEATRLLSDEVNSLVLVTESVTTNNDGLSPTRDETRNVLHDDGLTEDSTTEDVADGTVGREPHLLEVELLDTTLIRSDGGALDTDLVLLDSLSSLNSNLVLSGITVGKTKIVVLHVKIKIRSDELVLDVGPDDTGHLITIKVDDGVGDLNLAGGGGGESTTSNTVEHIDVCCLGKEVQEVGQRQRETQSRYCQASETEIHKHNPIESLKQQILSMYTPSNAYKQSSASVQRIISDNSSGCDRKSTGPNWVNYRTENSKKERNKYFEVPHGH